VKGKEKLNMRIIFESVLILCVPKIIKISPCVTCRIWLVFWDTVYSESFTMVAATVLPLFCSQTNTVTSQLDDVETILSPGRGNTTFLRIQHNLIVIYTKYYCYYERQQIAIFVGRHKTVVVLAYTLDRLDSFIIRVVDHWDENIWIRSGNKLLKA